MITAADACARAAAEMAAAPCSHAASDRVDRAILVLTQLGEQARCWNAGAAVIEAERARAVAEDRAARRVHLRSVG